MDTEGDVLIDVVAQSESNGDCDSLGDGVCDVVSDTEIDDDIVNEDDVDTNALKVPPATDGDTVLEKLTHTV